MAGIHILDANCNVVCVGNWSCSSSLHGVIWRDSSSCCWCNWRDETSTEASKGQCLDTQHSDWHISGPRRQVPKSHSSCCSCCYQF